MLATEFVNLLKTRRTVRQFRQEIIPQSVILECIETARLAPSARNLQPLEYFLVTEPQLCRQIFPLLRWAAYIAPQGNPRDDQRPTGYLAVLVRRDLQQSLWANDVGAAVENFLLSAWSFGIGTAWLASVQREELRRLLRIPESHVIDSVVAFGYPAETPVVEENDAEIRYFKDASGRLHVPKRSLKSILHVNRWNTDEEHHVS